MGKACADHETKSCVLEIHFGGETHFDLRCLIVVEKNVTNKCQSKNSTPAMTCLYKNNREHAFYPNCSSGGHTDVAFLLFILREGQDRRLTEYRLNNCSGEFTRERFCHLEIFEKMTNEWLSLLTPGDKIVPIIVLLLLEEGF
jgi:hypothetical protein